MLKRDIRDLQKKIGYRFKKPDQLTLALTHPSFVQGTEQTGQHNQRLEFLGDAILDMIISVELYKLYPDKREGFLTKARSAICHGKNLTQLAKELGIEPGLQLGEGEKRAKNKDRSQIMGDCLEAIIGAMYLDGGYKNTRKVVLKWLRPHLSNLESDMMTINHKGALQEWAQSHFGSNCFTYNLKATHGPDHSKQFTVEIKLAKTVIETATGFSKKEAESQAAELTLQKVRQNEAAIIEIAEREGLKLKQKNIAES